nr:hypothetical protein [Babesia bovis]
MSNDQPANQTDISYMSHSIPSYNSFEDKRSQYENISSQSFGINTYWINSPMSELNRNGRSTCNGGSQPQNWDTNAVHLGTPTDVPGSSQDDVLTNTLSAIGEYVSSTSGCLTDNTTRSPDFNRFAFDTHSLESHGVMESPTGSVQVANANATERPDRSVSFVYRYRTMMDRTASTRRIETMPRHFTYSDY